MKKIVKLDVIIHYTKFSETFIIDTDTRKTHIGGVISQNGKPITFYLQKIKPAEINDTTTER